jgi:flavin-binding protein dodecin
MVEKTIELTGTSANSIEEAVNIAVSRAAVTIQNIRRVHIKSIDATIENGIVSQWRVGVDLSFAVSDHLHE